MQLRKKWVIGLAVLVYLMCFPVLNFARTAPLSADQAFIFSASVSSPNQIDVKWKIAPGYYLYRQRLHISFDPDVITKVQLPAGKLKEDPGVGRYEIYTNHLVVPVLLLQTASQTIKLKVDYQGCSKDRFCYPPMHKTVTLNLNTVSLANPASTTWLPFSDLLTNHQNVIALLQHQHVFFIFSIFVLLGLLLAFTPCVLPMVPILTSIIVGQKQEISTKKAFLLSLIYVLGTALTYALAGLVAASLGSSLQVWLQKPWIILSVSSVFVLLSLSLFGFYDLRLPRRLQTQLSSLNQRQQGGRYVSVFLMGVVSTLIVSPCITAPLAGALIYIGQTGDMLFGATSLFALGLGMGIPLLVIGTSAGKWLPKSGPWMEAVKKAFGIIMLGMAIWLLSRILSPVFTSVLWGIFLCGIAFFLAIYLPTLIGKRRINHLLGALVGLSGMLVIAGGVAPDNLTQWMLMHRAKVTASSSFVTVHNLAQVKKELLLAQAQQRPVILDFYADWCESCIEMEKQVFQSTKVQGKLSQYVLLRADLTQNTADDEALLKHFDVIAPPTVLFFNEKGQEQYSQRIVGEVSATEFLTRLENLQIQNKMALKK